MLDPQELLYLVYTLRENFIVTFPLCLSNFQLIAKELEIENVWKFPRSN